VEGNNILQTLAEVAVTLTGLSGIVAALGGRSDEVFREFTENRFAPMGFLAFSGLAFVWLIVDLRKTQP
jgi:hypothetical protein